MSQQTTKFRDELIATANYIATRGKGILAADESTGTIGKRFEKIKVENNEPNRRDYRELLFRAEGFQQYISGVILYEETLYQKAADGTPFTDILNKLGVKIGIKVDKGTTPIPNCPEGETATLGLDDLAARCKKYYEAGARFAKWRAVLKIDPSQNCPTPLAVLENAHGLARYAAICQENGLVPIVEPEVLMDGNHSLQDCVNATERVLSVVVKALHDHKILLEGALLKPNMVTPGHSSPAYKTVTPEEVARATITVLQRTVPVSMPGIMFLSGGQSEEEASRNLNAMNSSGLKTPWSLSFSYGRALQASTLDEWKGDRNNFPAAQKALLERAKANSEAQLGKYGGSSTGSKDLHVEGYVY
eukprot:TRINITY_DN614_c0_g1_i1.p1 TRINITY_DN614_c0_g1~~TRINITY_DN614_c0_g1_i1.p1  ORF type:complete len:361 (+),score=121.55 TRINITY_DN614_c0_g1_i1:64-1146(+)